MSKTKIEKRFSANGLNIYLKLEGRVEEEVATFYHKLVHDINLSMQDVMNRITTEKLLNQNQPEEESIRNEINKLVESAKIISPEGEENKDWKKEFHKKFVQHYMVDNDIYNFYGYGDDAPQMGSGKEEVDKLKEFIQQEIDRAREDTLLEVRDEILEVRKNGRKYPEQNWGGHMDTLDIISGMLSKLTK